MNLAQALRIFPPPGHAHAIAFAGSGGKTSALFGLARELPPPVIVTTTTHFGTWQIPLADQHVAAQDPQAMEQLQHGLHGIILVTGPIEGDKTTPISEALLLWLREFCGYHDIPLLVEADGSRQKPLKAPAEHEPAIPPFVGHVVYVAGLAGLDRPLGDEWVHRPEIFARISGIDAGEIITTDALTRVLTHSQGGLKNIPAASHGTLILNQADTVDLQARASSMSPALLKAFDAVLVTSLNHEPQIHAVYENTAGIILAAGASTRFGKPKQLLDWHGEPFVRVVAKTALSTGLSPVIVVTGSNAENVESAVKDLNVEIVRNIEWQNGQSTSIKTGISALTPFAKAAQDNANDDHPPGNGFEGGRVAVGASIFLLADQPQIGADVIRALIETHARELPAIVAPLVLEERRANPVLFDRITFPDLLQLEGDIGGRAIFSKHKVQYMPWHDDRLLLDVDKPEDYQRLLEDETL